MGCIFTLADGTSLHFQDKAEAIDFFTENPEYQSQLIPVENGFQYSGNIEKLGPNLKDLGDTISKSKAVALFNKLLPDANPDDLIFISSLSDKGRYYKGVIELASTGDIKENVLKHEIFHKLFNEYLSKEERETYLKSAKELWDTADNRIAEELMARDFQVYKTSPETLSLKIARILRKIARLLNLIKNTPQEILDELYNNINKGKYKKVLNTSFKDTSVKNYEGILTDFPSVQAYKKASSTLDLDIYNRSKIEFKDRLSSNSIKDILTNTLGKKDAILSLPDFYSKKLEELNNQLTNEKDESVKLSIVESIDNLTLIKNNYRKLVQELYPQEYKAVKKNLYDILGDSKIVKEEDSEHTLGVIPEMFNDEKLIENIKNHEEVKSVLENKLDPEAFDDENIIVTDGFNREDAGNIFSYEIQDNNSKDNETDINDDVKWFLSHIPNKEGGFYNFRNVFPVAIDIISKINFFDSLSNQDPSKFSNGTEIGTAFASELGKLFEYIDPTITKTLNPNYTFINGSFAVYRKAVDEGKIKTNKLIEGYPPLNINSEWEDLRLNKEVVFLRKPIELNTLGEYINYISKFTNEKPEDIYSSYMQQEAKQILAGVVQSLGSYRNRVLNNVIVSSEDGITTVRNKLNTPVNASTNYKSKIVHALLYSAINPSISGILKPKLEIEDFISLAGFTKEQINKNFKSADLLAFNNLSQVIKDVLLPLIDQLNNLEIGSIQEEKDLIDKAYLNLYKDNLINSLAETIASVNGEFTASSVIDSEGKQKYLFVNSSNAYDVLDALKQPEVGFKTIEDLKSTKYNDNIFSYLAEKEITIEDKIYKTFYSFNPYIHNINKYKIYSVIDFDGTVDTNFSDSKVIDYTKEKEKDYLTRVFSAGFLNTLAVRTEPRYIQYLYTNSNRPTPLATEILLLSDKEIENSIGLGIEQLLNKLELSYLEENIESYNKNPFLNMIAFEKGIQEALNSKLKGKELLNLLKNKDNKKEVIKSIKKAIIKEDFNYIKDNLIRNEVPLEGNLNAAISKLQELNPEIEFKKVPSDFKYNYWKDQKRVYNYPQETDLIIEQFILNNYINNVFINQLIIGDPTVYGDANGVVKRMSIATAPGQKGYANALNGVPKEVDFIVAEDDVQEVLDEIFKDTNVEGMVYEATDAQMWFTDKFDNILKAMYGRKYGLSLVNKPVYHKTDSQGITRTIKTSGLNLGSTEGMHKDNLSNLQELNKILNSHNIMGVVPKSANKSGSTISKLELETRNFTKEELENLSSEAKQYLKELGVETVNHNTLKNSKNTSFYNELFKLRNSLKTGRFNIQLKSEDNKNNWDQSKFKLDTRFLRMQLNPSHDLDMNTSNPSQLQSFAGILVKPHTEKFVNSIYNDYAELAKIYRKELLNSLQTNNSFDNAKITNLLKETLQSKGSERLADVIKYIGIDHPSIYKKIQIQLSSIIEKKGLTTKFNGGKFTLISSHLFFNPRTKERLKFIEDSNTGNRYAEVLAPAALFNKDIQNKIKAGEDVYLHSEQLAFRIPSTELHSAVILKVVGFHTTKNNSLVLPQEIVPLHGSDYDVDALFLILKEKAKLKINYSKTEIKNGQEHTSYLQIPKDQPIGYRLDGVFDRSFDNVIKNQKETGNIRKNKKLDNLLKAYYKNRIMYNMMELIQNEKERMSNPISMDILKDEKLEGSMYNYLEGLNALAKSDNLDLSTFRDNQISYKSNMAGSALTGIMANNTKAIAVLTRAGEHNFNIEYLGKTLNSFSNTQEVFNTLDALVNAAIDNVKEQILFKGNISVETGNVVASMIGVGLPMNEVFGLIVQPIIRNISEKGYSERTKQELKKLLSEKLLEKGYSSENIQKLINGEYTAELSQEKLDSIIKNNPTNKPIEFDKLSSDQLEIQFNVLNKFEEFTKIGDILKDVSGALSILREAPSNYGNVKININTWQKIFNLSGLELVPVYNINNGSIVDLKLNTIETAEVPILNLSNFFKQSPYIKEAIITIYNHKIISEQSILFSPKLNSFVESFSNTNGKDIGLDKPVLFSLDSKQELHEEAVRENVLKLAMAQTFVDEIKDEVYEKISSKGNKFILKKASAFKEKFVQQVKNIKNVYKKLPLNEQNNKFLHYLVTEFSTKGTTEFVSFRQPSNLQEADVLDLQENFENLSNLELEGFSKTDLELFKYNLIKYSALSTGMSFGLTGYSQFIPGKALVENSNRFKKALEFITNSSDNLSFPLTVMLAKNNTKAFKSIGRNDLDNEKYPTKGSSTLLNGKNVLYDLLLTKKQDTNYSGIINYQNKAYILLGETKEGLAYRQLFPDTSVADFDFNVQEYLKNPIQLESVFEPSVREVFTSSIEDTEVNVQVSDVSLYKEGDIVTLTNLSDYFRENSIRAYIKSIDTSTKKSTIKLSYTKDTKHLNTSEKLDNFKKQFKVC